MGNLNAKALTYTVYLVYLGVEKIVHAERIVMVMTHQPKAVGKLGNRFIEILKDAGGEWLSRADIGRQINRRIQPYDVSVLENLVTEGLIESREALVGTVKTRREYRIKK